MQNRVERFQGNLLRWNRVNGLLFTKKVSFLHLNQRMKLNLAQRLSKGQCGHLMKVEYLQVHNTVGVNWMYIDFFRSSPGIYYIKVTSVS